MSFASLFLWVALVAQTRAIERESYEVYLCPVHRDEQASSPADCPVCQREMVQRILVPSYSCPMHPHIDEGEEGSCPICSMDLVATTREIQWYCENHPERVASLPGECPDGSSMAMRSVPMAHGDHNPKHGGILFMAPDGFHHLEGTIDDDGTFRLYLYDDFTRPIDAAPFEARIETHKLSPARGGDFLTASLPRTESYPAEVVLHVRFPGAHEEEARFDFVFQDDVEAVSLALPEFRIPETADGIFQEIMDRDRRVRELIRRGNWSDLYIPALEAKELVLALNEKEPERVGYPAKKLVRAAWLLDTYGDLGNRLEVESAYRLFEEAIGELEVAHAR